MLLHNHCCLLVLIVCYTFRSVRCFIRKKLIERGIVEWLIGYLEQLHPNMSNQNAVEKRSVGNDGSYKMKQASCYGLEYSTALFMNLCLHRSGKEKCLPMAKLVLQIFTHLLNTDVKQVIFHRNYSLILIIKTDRIC